MCKHRCKDKKTYKHVCCKDVKKREREQESSPLEEPVLKAVSVRQSESSQPAADKNAKIWVAETFPNKNESQTCDPATLQVIIQETRGIGHVPSPHYWLRYHVLRDAVLRGGHEELRRVVAPFKRFMMVWNTPGNGESVQEMLERGNAAAGTNLTREDLKELCKSQVLGCRGLFGVWCGCQPSAYSETLICGSEHLRPGETHEFYVSREDEADARFQIFSKYRAWGYNSPREMIRGEPDLANAAGVDSDD